MPTYDYRCDACGFRFETMQGITEAPLKKCPRCGGRVSRLIGAGAGLIFKGSGFYATDYRKDSQDRNPKSSSAGEKKKEGGEKTKESGDRNTRTTDEKGD